MDLKEFLTKYKIIIIIVVILLVAFIISAIYWKNKTVTNDLSLSNIENKINALETDLGLRSSSTSTVVDNKPHQPLCLNAATQQQIADEIKRKLGEINACDCRQTCAMNNIGSYQVEALVDNEPIDVYGSFNN